MELGVVNMMILHYLLCTVGWLILLAFALSPLLLKYCKHLEAKLAKEEREKRLYDVYNARG